ncbi:MAG: hypothetical protein A2X97_15090 [Bdellovibrionales bacterium GWA1_52_35]|nr:MAG: hypothetical protein A2X97_15090 [Bdellovibrionales bacterium GWA1_52_35]HCM40462.1 hypothetical protein [Bdellovibrionales bacterium]
MDDFEKELKSGFLDEAAQLLADAEQCFLNLESAADDPSIVEKLFRLAHNLKGSARAVGFGDIAEFTHQLESLLLKIKNKEIAIQASNVTLLLKCNDHLVRMVDLLKADMNARVDSSELLAEIGRHLSGDAESTEEVVSATPEQTQIAAQAAEQAVEDAVQQALDEALEAANSEVAAVVEGVVEDIIPSDEPAYPSADQFADLSKMVDESLKESPAAAVNNVLELPRKEPVQAPAAVSASAPSPVSGTAQSAPPAQQDESIRVSLKRLERLMNNVGELVILQAVLNQQKHQVQSVLIQKTIDQLAKITKDIQDISMSLRMVPLKQTFQKMQRIVRDTSMALNKDVRLDITGEETELDKIVLEQIGDPLVHLVRNAVDHGLETTEERLAAGKPAQGVVSLNAFHRGSHIVLEVKEDGRGLDAKKLTAKALEKGIVKPGQILTDEQAYQLIFASGFSTKTQITDISGRGVGMDVVRSNIAALQGEIQVETEPGKGTTFRVLLPLTLSIIDGMVVQTGEERYVVPIAQVHESVQPEQMDVHHVSGMGDILSLRGENLPLFRLAQVLGRKTPVAQKADSAGAVSAWNGIAIVVRTGKNPFAIFVDDIIGHQQVVIKRLGNEVQNIKGISGGAILGDGRAALILDFTELVSRTAMKSPAALKGVA